MGRSGFVRRFRRTLLAGVASCALVLGSVAGAAGQEGGFVNGFTKATALVAKVAPGVGNLELGISTGSAVSETRNLLAQAQAQALDFGLIGLTLTAEGCDGGDGFVTPDQLPQPLLADNRQGRASASEDEFPIADATIGGGRKEVEVSEDPMARAVVTALDAQIGPLLGIKGARAEAITRIVDGRAREALAKAELSLDIGGVIQLSGLRWEAFHRTGADPQAYGDFTIGRVEALGDLLPFESVAAVDEGLNLLLAATNSGISIEFPRVERFQEPTDLVRVTPLTVVLRDSPLGAATLGPLLNATREQREQLFNELAASFCQSAGLLLVGDIVVTILSGSGFFAVSVGGAEATTSEVEIGNPFGDGEDGWGTSEEDGPVADVVDAGVAPASDGDGIERGEETLSAASRVPVEERCESVHPFRWPPCSRGAALPLGVAGLLLTGAAAMLDWRHQRSRSRMEIA